MKRAIIVDLDGTLANIDHRLHLVKGEKKNWKLFFERMNFDEVNEWCYSILSWIDSYNNNKFENYYANDFLDFLKPVWHNIYYYRIFSGSDYAYRGNEKTTLADVKKCFENARDKFMELSKGGLL